MKSISLHIIFLLGFLFAYTESTAQESKKIIDKKRIELNHKIEHSSLDEVKKYFNDFAEYTLDKGQDSILSEAILVIGKYYKRKGEYGERINWYQFALDSLCKRSNANCINIRREFAEIFSSIENYEKAIELSQKNIRILDSINLKSALTLEKSLIAKYYFKKGDYQNSERYYLKSLESAISNNNTFFITYTYNNIGFYFSQLNNFPQAEKYYLKGIQLLEEKDSLTIPFQSQLALLKGNLGGNYLKGDKIEQGIQYLNEDINFNLKNGGFDLAINATAELANYFYENKLFENANTTLINSLNTLNTKIDSLGVAVDLVPIYHLLFKTKLEQQQNKQALVYFRAYDSLKTIRDERRDARRSSIEKSLLENILKVQLDYQDQQIKLKIRENEALEEKNRHFFYRLVIGLLSFAALVIFILLYSRKRISLMRIKKELAENQVEVEKLAKDKAKIELQFKNKDLTDFAIDISRKQEVLTDVKSKLNEILNINSEEETKKKIKNLVNYTNNNMLVDENLKEFQDNVEEVNYKFLDQLRKNYPELTELDMNVCGLIRLGLSNKEIATMRNVSYKAIRMSRYRIRKKLNLPAEINLVEFLKSIE